MADPEAFDPTIQTENIGFSPGELVCCDRCGRANAPNRLDCIYCGTTLDVPAERLEKIAIRSLEPWEPGQNIIVASSGGNSEKAAKLLSMDPEQLEGILASGIALPIARLEGKPAAIVAEKLRTLGFNTVTVADAELSLQKPPTRLAGLRMDDEGFDAIDLNTREQYRHSWKDLRLLVSGSFSAGKIDTMEKRRLRRTTVITETMTSTDEPIFDIYTANDRTGCRIQTSGFDYSCLGTEMSPLASGNIARLMEVICSRASDIRRVDYRPIRHLLTGIWDIESRKDPKGLQQTGLGKREFGVVHSTSNFEQFTRFSRLQRLML